ncbi:hypothetical protein HPE63_11205 [Maribacter arenosus]|uniref:Uncharacterized protein n=1 Tax=Maribacter arenosus TaxID=1854708 RepID=A0ABR7VE78_9FLAO|nr:hypothetical protein [Maribacter arenosus]
MEISKAGLDYLAFYKGKILRIDLHHSRSLANITMTCTRQILDKMQLKGDQTTPFGDFTTNLLQFTTQICILL